MKGFFITLITICIPCSIPAQSLQLSSSVPETIPGLSASYSSGEISIYDADGTPVNSVEYDLPAEGDDSFSIYTLFNGGFFVRENISNFEFYDSFGNLKYTISNNAGSPDGESVSDAAFDNLKSTIVVYNPKIIFGGDEGSRASYIDRQGNAQEFYFSRERYIKDVVLSDNAGFIGVITADDGTDDQISVFDRFGNSLQTISFDQEIAGAHITGSGRYITVFSGGRAAVYNVLSGERTGSTSFRRAEPVQFAGFIPEDNTIISLTAEPAGNTLTKMEVHAINISARKIARQSYNGTLNMMEGRSFSIRRSEQFNYTITGLNEELNIEASF